MPDPSAQRWYWAINLGKHTGVDLSIMTKLHYSIILIAGLTLSPAAHGGPIFTLDPPSGGLFGNIGATVGWGFTLSNSTNFLLVDRTDFCVGADATSCPVPLGTYTDFTSSQFIVVG